MTSTYGITGYGGYIPRLRIPRAAIAAAHQWMAPQLRGLAKGQRAFCSWDEDSITMAVEAARDALDLRARGDLGAVYLASTTLPYADLQNSTLLASALNLNASIRTLDIGHSQRSGVAGLLATLKDSSVPALFVASDAPRGKPASVQEISYGAGAAAFTTGSNGVIAELLGTASRSEQFVDHFRSAEEQYDYTWEERWIRDEGYLKIVPDTVKEALKTASVAINEVSHFILASPLKGISSAVAKKLGLAPETLVDAFESEVGYSGVAHPLLMLANALETAEPGDVLVLVGFGQGSDVLVLRATDAIRTFKPRRGVSGAVADAQTQDAYLRFLSYGKGIDLEWGMRAEKNVKTALTEQYRSVKRLSSFAAGKCQRCNIVQFPQLPYCVNPTCHAPRSEFEDTHLFDEKAQVLTYTADWLTYHPAPPLYVGFVQFDNGARLLMETVDIGAQGIDVGTPLRMVFRIKDIDKTRGYARYFWKATPLSA
ncbi:3-oxoacyl-[acyl-carrier-protein] synthase III C-terminal domain-containing protein [Pseudomonas marginalis]|uniref:3-oxoacyl-[acyl-carrier-protein] synthase III C-terminal domain-containing protein n=1 Tax=Pseudomonas marginalis TaxID=298 RepID=UPI0024817922|nr:3-oxoacyl-[acyl-carrier-protein] synthase III C-terminal domain-containing protein [Pseudomonas marginalis]WGT27972.1 3-oxoacyl-[acyl-carrier-protein] synthase III C-terminal domain-containing protein [Pseudomonas marginalis]